MQPVTSVAVAGLIIAMFVVEPASAAKRMKGGNKPAPAPAEKDAAGKPSAGVQAFNDMKAAEASTRQSFETGTEFVAAQDAVKQAQADYDAASGPVLKAIRERPEYVAAKVKQAADEAALSSNQGGNAGQVSDGAKLVMEDRTAIKQMENGGLAANPSIREQQNKLSVAAQAVTALRKKEQAAVEADPAWQDAKKRYDAVSAAKP